MQLHGGMEDCMNAERSTIAIEQIGRYRVIGELGRGGMGIVYRAHDAKLGRAIALKMIRGDETERSWQLYTPVLEHWATASA